MSSDYERELRYLLGGKRDVVEKLVDRVARTDPKAARKYRQILETPFFVLRSAGSLGIDLVALRGEISFPIEVKTSNEEVVRMSRSQRQKEQAEELVDECRQSGLVPLYAYRRRDMQKHDPWRMFLLTREDLDAKYDRTEGNPVSGLLYRKMRGAMGRGARADVTDAGNYVLRWEEGWPLYEFIDYVTDYVRHRRTRSRPTVGTDSG